MSKTITIPIGVGNPVSVWVNGRKYSYPAGTTQTVPDEVAAIFESKSIEHVSYGRRAGAPLRAEGPLNDNEFLPVFATSDGRLRIRKSDLEELIHSGVVANPTLAGTEADLTGLQVGDTKYKVSGSSGGGVLVVTDTDGTLNKTYAEIAAVDFAVVIEESDVATTVGPVDEYGANQDGYYVHTMSGKTYSTDSANGYPVKGGGK